MGCHLCQNTMCENCMFNVMKMYLTLSVSRFTKSSSRFTKPGSRFTKPGHRFTKLCDDLNRAPFVTL